MCKSQTSFEIVQRSGANDRFSSRILLMDDLKKSLATERVGVIVKLIRDKQICDLDTWSNRNILKDKLIV